MEDRRIGTELVGRYRILERLAAGGMGVVYRGERIELGRSVAIKFLHAWIAADRSFLKRFEIEAKTMAKLQHPNCASVFDFGIDGTDPFVVMDLVAGQPLIDIIEGERLIPARCIDITRQVLAGLGHAHQLGFFHRDIKPANIMVNPTSFGDQVRILDFGLAKLREGAPGLTAGFVVGTPSYMAPEQTLGDPVDERTDIYATGVMLFEMLTGVKPFRAENALDLVGMHRIKAPPRLAEADPETGFSEALEAVVARALAKLPSERFASVEEFALALSETPEGAGMRARTSQPMRVPTAEPVRLPTAEPVRAKAAEAAPAPAAVAAAGKAGTKRAFSEPTSILGSASIEPIDDPEFPSRPAGVADTEPGAPQLGAVAGTALAQGARLASPPDHGYSGPPSVAGTIHPPAAGTIPPPVAGTIPPPVAGTIPPLGAGTLPPGAQAPAHAVQTQPQLAGHPGHASTGYGPGPTSQVMPSAQTTQRSPEHSASLPQSSQGAVDSSRMHSGQYPAPKDRDQDQDQASARRRLLIGGGIGLGVIVAIVLIIALTGKDDDVPVDLAADNRAAAAGDSKGEPGEPSDREPSDSADRNPTEEPEIEEGEDLGNEQAGQGADGSDALAEVYAQLERGRTSSAQKMLEKLKYREPNNPEVFYLLGKIYMDKLWVDDGLKSYSKALRLDPNYREHPEVVQSIINGFGSDGDHRAVSNFLVNEIGEFAIPYLEKVVNGNYREDVRERAARTLSRLQ